MSKIYVLVEVVHEGEEAHVDQIPIAVYSSIAKAQEEALKQIEKITGEGEKPIIVVTNDCSLNLGPLVAIIKDPDGLEWYHIVERELDKELETPFGVWES